MCIITYFACENKITCGVAARLFSDATDGISATSTFVIGIKIIVWV